MNKTEDSIVNKQHLNDKIIKYASKEFLSKGIKAVKMDDIAKALVISKRTLYETFDNKEQLLLACVMHDDKIRQEHFDNYIEKNNPNVISIFVEFYRYQLQGLSDVTSKFLLELHKYPSVMNWLEEQHKKRDKEGIYYFKKGVEEGYFRKDANYDLIRDVCSSAMDYALQQGLLKRYSAKEIFKDVMLLYIRGFCTLKGIEVLEKLL